ncbi:MAG: biotin transporter BioY [Firmicutes bacterium]|nr:biotin transporter BioY [Bacillota bacterium]
MSLKSNLVTRKLVLVGVMAALMSVAAFVRIPIPPVAISLQSLVVLLSGLVLGPWLGAASQIVYILLGLMGLPVFTAGGGLSYLFKPSFGYLLGFIPAAWLIGRSFHPQQKAEKKKLLGVAILAHLVIYAIGLPYLYISLRFFAGTPVPFLTLLKTGFLIFLPGDILKSIFFVAVGQRLAGHHTLASFRESC